LEAIFLLPVNPGGHAAYQDHVLAGLRKHYPDLSSIPKSSWAIIERFLHLNLDNTDLMMRDRYSVFGPMPRLPSCMLRSYLLSLEFGIASVTNWAASLKTCPLHAVLSGFHFGDTPGVGTFYDFFARLWLSEDDNFSPNPRAPKVKVKKPSSKGAKADAVDKVTVEELIFRFSNEPVSSEQPFSLLFDIFKDQFLDVSIHKGLINPESLSLAGDGMPVCASARERKKRLCRCLDNGIRDCACIRFFSQPDCDVGWDSSRDRFFSGYGLYTFVASDSANDLPVFPLLNPASRHDSQAFVYSLFFMMAFLPEFKISKLLLDSAHDAMSVYEFCRNNNIVPFIDLNEKRGVKLKYKDDFVVGADGIPVCLAGLKMRRDGSEPKKYRLKFRCPLMNRKNGCSCQNPCSDAKFGRTVHLALKDNPRIFNLPPRETDVWKDEFKNRTSAERSNKRIKIDFQLENGKHRSSKMWYCRLFCILMLQHLNAWGFPDASPLSKLMA
jgi:hypothetical protein